jgi:integrase
MAAYFGEKRLADITVADIAQYRTLRQATVGPNRINKELNMLAQMLKKAGLWDEIGKWYERLPEAKTPVGIALEPEEEAHLFSVAATRSRWRVAYLAGVLSRNTGAGPGEIRQLTLSNIDCVDYAWIRIVRGLKNRCRLRVLDCNQDARWALAGLRERAERQGAYLPEHYLLPARGPDPTKPMTHWHKAWWALRKEAGKKYPRLLHVRLYDMRHCCATALLANPHIPYNVIEAILGHQVNSDTKRLV